jgi:hypothetical protein
MLPDMDSELFGDTTIIITEMTDLSLAIYIPLKFMILKLFPVSLYVLA